MHKKVMTAIALLPIFALSVFVVNNQNFTFSNLATSSAEAVQLRDGKTYFVHLPMLIEAETTDNRIYARGVTYYFAIALPQNMGEPLQKLEINQTEGFDSIDFFGDDTIAYLQSASGDRIAVSSKTDILPSQSRDRPKTTITFDPPIPASNAPNSKLIVGIRPVHNPYTDGVYLFGVTAFPQGDRPNPQFLSYGRLSFYSSRY